MLFAPNSLWVLAVLENQHGLPARKGEETPTSEIQEVATLEFAKSVFFIKVTKNLKKKNQKCHHVSCMLVFQSKFLREIS